MNSPRHQQKLESPRGQSQRALEYPLIKSKYIQSRKLHIVCTATKSEGYFPYLKKSCDRYGVKLTVLGWGQKFTGFRDKINWTKEFVSKCDPDDLILVIDAYDIIFVRDPTELIRYYRLYSELYGPNKIIMSSEWSGGIRDYFTKFVFGTCKGTQINVGSYLGAVKSVKSMLDQICLDTKCSSKTLDDQLEMTKYCNKFPHKVDIDLQNELFLVRGMMDSNIESQITYNDGKLYYRSHRPYLIHYSGKQSMREPLLQLGYNIKEDDAAERPYYKRVLQHHLKLALKSYKYYIIGFIAVIFIIVKLLKK